MMMSSSICTSAKFWAWQAFFLLLLTNNGASQSIIKNLPGFSGDLPFKLETGYVSVGKFDELQMFYYFIESERSPENDPLLLWMTGGPRCSSFYGLVYEIGPISFQFGDLNKDPLTLVTNPYAWTKLANIIFLDAPAGTGFSYSTTLEGYISSDTLHATRAYEFLKRWLVTHPQFLANPLYISGDSYTGKIVPIIVQHITDDIEAGTEPPLKLKVTASAWINDLRNQIEQTRILSIVYRSASALGSRLPSIASAKAKVAGSMDSSTPCFQWYTGCYEKSSEHGLVLPLACHHGRAWLFITEPQLLIQTQMMKEVLQDPLVATQETFDPLLTPPPKRITSSTAIETIDLPVSSSVGIEWTSEIDCSYSNRIRQDTDGDIGDEREGLTNHDRHEDRMIEVELWQQLKHELYDRTEGEDADVENEIREEEEAAIAEASDGQRESYAPDRKYGKEMGFNDKTGIVSRREWLCAKQGAREKKWLELEDDYGYFVSCCYRL